MLIRQIFGEVIIKMSLDPVVYGYVDFFLTLRGVSLRSSGRTDQLVSRKYAQALTALSAEKSIF